MGIYEFFNIWSYATWKNKKTKEQIEKWKQR